MSLINTGNGSGTEVISLSKSIVVEWKSYYSKLYDPNFHALQIYQSYHSSSRIDHATEYFMYLHKGSQISTRRYYTDL
jgi:hypothetical protein